MICDVMCPHVWMKLSIIGCDQLISAVHLMVTWALLPQLWKGMLGFNVREILWLVAAGCVFFIKV